MCDVRTLARCDPNHSNYWPSVDCQSAGTYSAVQTTRHSINPTHRPPACVAVSAVSFSVTCDRFIPRLVYSFDIPFKHWAQKSDGTFPSNASRCPMTTAFWKVPRLCPSVLLGGLHVGKDEYGALVEWYWQGKQKYCEKILSQCHLVHHKSYMDWPGIESGPPQWDAANWPPDTTIFKKTTITWIVFIDSVRTAQ